MITKFEIKGFKTLVDVTVPLSPGITVIVGANNSGKTNFFRAVELLSAAARSQLESALISLGGHSAISTSGGPKQVELSVHGEVDASQASYALRSEGHSWEDTVTFFDPAADQERSLLLGRYTLSGQSTLHSGGSYPPHQISAVHDLLVRLGNARLIDISLDLLRSPSTVSASSTMSSRGEGVAATLDRIRDSEPHLFDAIVKTVREAAPEVQRIVTPTVEDGKKTLGVQEVGGVMRADQMSDGLLLFIALAAVIHMAGSMGGLLLIEEPDRGIHPRRVRQVMDNLRLLTQKGIQVVLTTHSPILLDEFRDEPEAVLLFDRDEAGTHVTRLSDKPELVDSLNGASLGDVWYSGILGGVPAR